MKVPKVPFVKPAPEQPQAEVEAEAAAELRRALALGDPRPGVSRSPSARKQSPYSRRPEPPVMPSPQEFGPSEPSATPDDEKQAITDLALQQLAEREVATPRRGDAIPGRLDASSPEEMRNRALAELAERRNRMAQATPPPRQPAASVDGADASMAPARERTPGALRRAGGPVVQRRSGMTGSPRPTVSPTPTPTLPPTPTPSPVSSPGRAPSLSDITGRAGGIPTLSDIAATVKQAPSRPVARAPKVAFTPRDAATVTARSPGAGPVRLPVPSGDDSSAGPWRFLVELADLLGRHVFPIDALPDVCEWLADVTDSEASIMLLASSGVDEVVAWPPDAPLFVDLAALTGGPLDPDSGLWAAVRDGETVVADADEPMVLPAGVSAECLGATAAVPLVGGDMTFGLLVVHQPDSGAISDQTVALVEEVAPRLALALGNAEQASQNGGAPPDGPDEEAMAEVSVATLSAVAILLGSLEALPGPSNDGSPAGRYDEIARNATKLRNLVEQFLDDVTG